MKIRIIGCGNAFSYINFNQSFVLEEGGHRRLIDCGSRVPLAPSGRDLLQAGRPDLPGLRVLGHRHGEP